MEKSFKKCKECDLDKDINLFTSIKGRVCSDCKGAREKERKAGYYIDNKETINARTKKYWSENKEWLNEWQSQYFQDNKVALRPYRAAYAKEKRATDALFRLRHIVSVRVADALKKKGSSKNGRSVLKFLEYTIDELRMYLESLWESWMTWDNHGMYDAKTWDDDDSSTWTWQIDHIMPHSNFNYTSLEDPLFKECWALSNLRPLSAKQNNIDRDRKYLVSPNQAIQL